MPEATRVDIRTAEPPPEALRWVATAAGARVVSVRALPGATSSALHAVDVVSDAGARRTLALRRYVLSEWLALEPDLAEREARVLTLLKDTAVPTPEVVAVDATGAACDVPAVLTTLLPGRVVLVPEDMDRWLDGLTRVLLDVHAVDAPDTVQPYRAYSDLSTFEAPGWSRAPEAWARAINLIRGPAPHEPAVFIHRDYHPANVLWDDDAVSGVIDWTNASRGPAAIDVGHCRVNLAQLHGVEVADRFLDRYEALAGASAHQPYWDLISIADGPHERRVYEGWAAHGVRGLTHEIIGERIDAYVTSVVGRL